MVTKYGFGKDIWTLPPSNLPTVVEYLYIMAIIYVLELCCIRLVLTLFYLRIFQGTVIKRLLLGTVAFTIIYTVVCFFVSTFQCWPVSFYWMQYSGGESSRGRCVDSNIYSWCFSGFSIAADLWLLGIPLSQVPKMRLTWAKKLLATTMFLLGSL